jgi:hypothetical protein
MEPLGKEATFKLVGVDGVHAFEPHSLLSFCQTVKKFTCPFTRRELLLPEIRRLFKQCDLPFSADLPKRFHEERKQLEETDSVFGALEMELSDLLEGDSVDAVHMLQVVQNMVEICPSRTIDSISAHARRPAEAAHSNVLDQVLVTLEFMLWDSMAV